MSVALLVYTRRDRLHCAALFAPPDWFGTVRRLRRSGDRPTVAAENRG